MANSPSWDGYVSESEDEKERNAAARDAEEYAMHQEAMKQPATPVQSPRPGEKESGSPPEKRVRVADPDGPPGEPAADAPVIKDPLPPDAAPAPL